MMLLTVMKMLTMERVFYRGGFIAIGKAVQREMLQGLMPKDLIRDVQTLRLRSAKIYACLANWAFAVIAFRIQEPLLQAIWERMRYVVILPNEIDMIGEPL